MSTSNLKPCNCEGWGDCAEARLVGGCYCRMTGRAEIEGVHFKYEPHPRLAGRMIQVPIDRNPLAIDSAVHGMGVPETGPLMPVMCPSCGGLGVHHTMDCPHKVNITATEVRLRARHYILSESLKLRKKAWLAAHDEMARVEKEIFKIEDELGIDHDKDDNV